MGFVVWKLGGSLFDLPNLAERIKTLKREQFADTPVVIIPGGGIFADAVRQLDRTHSIRPLDSHWMALEAMQLSAKFVASILKQPLLSDSREQDRRVEAWRTSSEFNATLEVWDVIRHWNDCLPDLEFLYGSIPADWSLTSDSIAAVYAAFWKAEQFVLCKSIDPPASPKWKDWAEEGAVDSFFPQIAPHVKRIEWVNLRAQ